MRRTLTAALIAACLAAPLRAQTTATTGETQPVILFDTVARAITARGFSQGTLVRTRGYFAKNDGGGNLYRVSSTALGTADGGKWIDIANDPPKQLVAVDTSHFYAKQYGIVAADDATDDSTAFTAFMFSGADVLEIDDATTVNLDGDWSIVQMNEFVHPPRRVFCRGVIKSTTAADFVTIAEATRLSWTGGEFTGFGTVFEFTTTAASMWDVDFHDIAFTACELGITDNGGSNQAQHRRITVDQCRFDDLTIAAIVLRARFNHVLNITRNEISDFDGAGSFTGIHIGDDYAGWGGSSYTLDDAGTVNVSGNYVHDLVSSGSSTAVHGIVVRSPAANVVNNHIENLSNANGVSEEGMIIAAEYGRVAGNLIRNAGGVSNAMLSIVGDHRGASPSDGPGWAVRVVQNSLVSDDATNRNALMTVNQDDCVVAGNLFEGNDRQILIAGDNTVVSQNECRDAGIAGSPTVAIDAYRANNLTVSDNQIINCGVSGQATFLVRVVSDAAATSGFTVTDNLASGADGSSVYGLQIQNSYAVSDVVYSGNNFEGCSIGVNVTDDANLSDALAVGNHFPGATIAYDASSYWWIDGQRMASVTGATPSAVAGSTLVCANGGATTITDITDGAHGMVRTVILDANTTLDDGTKLELLDNVDFNPGERAAVTLVYDAAADLWTEISRTPAYSTP